MQSQANPDVIWISAPQVRARYGNRSAMWLHRKLKFDSDFPKATYFGRLMFFKVSDIIAYEHAVVARGKPSAPKQPNTKKNKTKARRAA
jgi:hypothetical protein